MTAKIDESKLRQLVDEDLQNYKIAEHFGCAECTIERRLKKLGIKKLRTGPKSGDRHTGWKGGTQIIKGYRYIYSQDHPNKTKKGYVAEHRLVMEKKLGRYLDRKEVVHHKNEDRLDNHISNLELFETNGEHLFEHLSGNKEHADKIREAMKNPDVRKQMRKAIERFYQQKNNPIQLESDDHEDIQTTDHQT